MTHTRIEDAVFAKAALEPNTTAISSTSERVSYDALCRRAERIANAIGRLRRARGAIVAIHLERTPDLPISVIATLMSETAFLMLDPCWSTRRKRHILNAAANPPVVTTRTGAADPALAHACCIIIDDPLNPVVTDTGLVDTVETLPEDLAYVVFTSGSTGEPKGAMNGYAALQNRIAWMQDQFHLGPEDRVLHKTPVGFDVSIWELIWPLTEGAEMVLAAPGHHAEFPHLIETINAHAVTVCHFVPSLLRLFLLTSGADSCTSLRAVMCSGEALSGSLRDQYFDTLDAELHNLYGPAEAAIDVSHWQCHVTDSEPSVPIGRPIWQTRLHIVDANLHTVSDGQEGELCIAGTAVGLGYLGRSDLTDKSFVEIQSGNRRRERVYRTGDLARRRPDGALEFLGRLDRQIKLAGIRVEPGEIEAALERHADITACAVRPRLNEFGESVLVAFVVARAPVDPGSLNAFLNETFAGQIQPSVFVKLEAFPLTANGKRDDAALDRIPLPSTPAWATPSTTVDDKAIGDADLVNVLAKAWSDILQTDAFGTDDNFFDVGGHSLLVVQMHQRLQRDLGVRFPVLSLFEHPTVTAQARFFDTYAADR